MAMRIPYAVEVRIVRRRLETDLDTVSEEFDVSKMTIQNVMKRNPDLVEQIKSEIRNAAAKQAAKENQ